MEPLFIEGGLGEVASLSASATAATYGAFRYINSKFDVMPYGRRSKRMRGHPGTVAPTYAPALPPIAYAIDNGKSRYHHNLGTNPFSKTTKRHGVKSVTNMSTDKKLYVHRLISTLLPSVNESDNPGRRKGPEVHVRGVRYDAWFDLLPNYLLTRPLDVRWAVINPRENNGQVGSVDSGNDFFASVGYSNEGDNDTDFPDSGDWFDYMSQGINRRDFGVLKEGRFTIDANQALNTSSSIPFPTGADPNADRAERVQPANMQKYISFYLPIQKRMKFSNDSLTHPDTNLFFVFWFVQRAEQLSAQRFDLTNCPLRHRYRHITYFSDLTPYK